MENQKYKIWQESILISMVSNHQIRYSLLFKATKGLVLEESVLPAFILHLFSIKAWQVKA